MNIPNGWKEVKLFDVVSIQSKLVDPKRAEYSSLILIAPDHIESRTGIIINKVSASEQNAISNKFLVEKDDVIYSKIRPYLMKSCIAEEKCLCSADMYPFRCSEKIIPKYLQCILLSKNFTTFTTSCSVRTGIPKINREELSTYRFSLPPLAEQQKIARVLCAWDAAIEKTETLVAEKKRAYSAILNKSIRIYSCGERKLEKSLEEISVRNKNNQIERVLSVSNANGFVLSEEQFGKRVASSDLSNYKIVSNGDFAYNPSRINVGSISRLDMCENGVVSPMYVVFKIIDESIDSSFFLHWLNSNQAKHRIKNSAQGSVRETVSFDDFSQIHFPKISIEHQQLIGNFLTNAKKEITLLHSLAGEYRKQKQWLMQNLLTGTLRVK